MRIGIVGRNALLLHEALGIAEGAGHDARGTLADDEARAWVSARQIEALVVGGGVEEHARDALLAACSEHEIAAVLVQGPGVLGAALRELAER